MDPMGINVSPPFFHILRIHLVSLHVDLRHDGWKKQTNIFPANDDLLVIDAIVESKQSP